MAYQMCTGRAPFDDVSPLVVLRLHADKVPPPPHELNPDLPAPIEQVLLKALAKSGPTSVTRARGPLHRSCGRPWRRPGGGRRNWPRPTRKTPYGRVT